MTKTPLLSAILVTGGIGGTNFSYIQSVELLKENGSYLCSLPDLPYANDIHTQSGLVTCGGASTHSITSCLTFSMSLGQWTTSHSLQYQRLGHSAWQTNQGILLFGSVNSMNTSEILTDDGQSMPSFGLKYDTK